ncbi:GCN5-related N-acetyltransferase [Gemmatirosa kalamazoonensis]|uniref:GCN5-related N-acetyltransferase n=1 Tax=Gemmatirosa kalamazoonensis TaxID=861299 RepID=W0RN27_9BACT|nr:helix-turn-helix domain-containing GNAT family N-acetyltransferase [Gemmatirosa kalamazoonensis]AHG91897.1 GCN5-related N-acetyltransferase [Gemmatirosa kalamazoonensis]
MSTVPTDPVPADAVAAVRRFNRFYTRLVGALDEGHLATEHSLAEARVLYELAHRDAPTATEVGRDLRLDAGYLSRIVRRLERAGLVTRAASTDDARRRHLRLTEAGRAAAVDLEARAHHDVASHVAALPAPDHPRLLAAMRTIESLLGRADQTAIVLRDPRPGDYGWVIARNGALYAREYGWDVTYEALVARIVADFAAGFDPRVERCWIAERDGENVGCIFCVRHPERPGVAKLRLLLVEPSARGAGLGARLVRECIAFARSAGYHTMTLWTNSVLASARRIYQAAGFQLVEETPNRMFGHELVGQTWELTLR